MHTIWYDDIDMENNLHFVYFFTLRLQSLLLSTHNCMGTQYGTNDNCSKFYNRQSCRRADRHTNGRTDVWKHIYTHVRYGKTKKTIKNTLSQLTIINYNIFCLFEFKITYACTYTTAQHSARAQTHKKELIIPTQKDIHTYFSPHSTVCARLYMCVCL